MLRLRYMVPASWVLSSPFVSIICLLTRRGPEMPSKRDPEVKQPNHPSGVIVSPVGWWLA
jgi:hypothetical protein